MTRGLRRIVLFQPAPYCATTMREFSRTIAVTALVGVFVALGTGVLCDLAARLLPTHAEQATILGRDTHQTILPDLATRTRTFASVRRIILAREDGTRFTVDAPRGLYDRAVPGLIAMEGTSVNIRRSVLFGKPVELELMERPLVDLAIFPRLRVCSAVPDTKLRHGYRSMTCVCQTFSVSGGSQCSGSRHG